MENESKQEDIFLEKMEESDRKEFHRSIMGMRNFTKTYKFGKDKDGEVVVSTLTVPETGRMNRSLRKALKDVEGNEAVASLYTAAKACCSIRAIRLPEFEEEYECPKEDFDPMPLYEERFGKFSDVLMFPALTAMTHFDRMVITLSREMTGDF